MPKLSVGMPVFNGAELVSRAIESILSQSLSDLELVISDNGSTDATPDICREFARSDRRVRYFRQPKNIGALGNFRYVVSMASAPFFFWAPHDDWWHPGFAEAGTRALELRPDAAAAMGVVRYVDRDGKEFSRDQPPYGLDQGSSVARARAYLRQGLTDNLVYAMYRRNVLLSAPYASSACPEKAIIMHAVLSGPLLDAAPMEYANQVSFKDRQGVADALLVDLSDDREEAKVFWSVLQVMQAHLKLAELTALFPLFILRNNWHKFFARAMVRRARKLFSRV